MVVTERLREALPELDARPPAELALDLAEVRPEVADVDRLAVRRKRHGSPRAPPVQLDEQLRELRKGDRIVVPEVVDLPSGFVPCRGEEKGCNGVVDVVQVSALEPVPVHIQALT